MTRHALFLLAPLAAALLVAACEPDERAPAGDGDDGGDGFVPPIPCVDRDGDGFGERCENGWDCDDFDPTRATECPAVAVPCEPGAQEACYRMLGASASTLSCATGTRTCTGAGLWGVCEVEEEFEKPIESRAVITPAEPCNPCAPSCGRATDYPVDTDLTTDNSDNVEYNPGVGGITLDDNSNDPSSPIYDADGDGVPDDYDAVPTDPLLNGFTENGDIFAVLPFNGPLVTGRAEVEVRLRSADIYFLMDTTGSMQGEIDNLRTNLTQGNFVTSPELCGLSPAEGVQTIANWNAEYYDNLTLAGAPAFTRIDPQIAFADFPPAVDPVLAPSFDNQDMSVRWWKDVEVPAGATVAFDFLVDDGIRIRIDGAIVWDAGWRYQGDVTYQPVLNVAPGLRRIAIEYFQGTGPSTALASARVVGPAAAGYEGLIGALSCQLADPTFGLGYFDDYPIARFGYSRGDGACNDTVRGTEHDLPFFQLIGATPPLPTANRDLLTAAVDKLSARCGDDVPESHLPGLYALATGAGLPDTRLGEYARPAVQVVEGADMLRAPDPLLPVGAPGPVPNVPWVDYDAGDVTNTPKAFTGSTSTTVDRHSNGNCSANNGAPDRTFRFQVSEDDVPILISTQGSAFDTTLHLYRSDGTLIACDDQQPSGNHSLVFRDLDAGTYFVTIDAPASNFSGNFRIYLGPVVGDGPDHPLDLGDLSTRFVQLGGHTDPPEGQFRDNTGTVRCWGGDKNNGSEDVVFRFTLSQTTNVVITNAGTTMGSAVLQLRDGSFDYRYCNNGEGSQASIFQRLRPGTYHVVISSAGSGSGDYQLGIGAWRDNPSYLTRPGPVCPADTRGYPCFRTGAVPIVVLFTDAAMHNGYAAHARYTFAAPAYMDAVTALNDIGAKVIGIHSGTAPSTSCSTPCTSYEWNTVCETEDECVRDEYVTVCNNETYCAETETYDDCRTRTVCAEYGAPVTTCSMVTVCQQGGICWQEEVCSTSTPCIRTELRTTCTRRSRCIRVDTREVCNLVEQCAEYAPVETCETRRGACLTWGPTTCNTAYATAHSQLRQLAVDTSTVDTDGDPFVYHINSNGTGLSEAVVTAIAELSGTFRLDITLRPRDNPVTTIVDERDFVKSIATVSTGTPPPETLTRCAETGPDYYRDCLAGTDARFVVGFRNDFVPPAMDDQLFEFDLEVLGDGAYVLGTVRVNILVPAVGSVFVGEGRYWRDYDSQEHCAPDQVPVWGNFDWDADLPAGTSILWEFRTGATEADLDSSDVAVLPVPPNTPPARVDDVLRSFGVQRNYRWMRATAVLRSSPGGLNSPVLRGFEATFTCNAAD